MPKPGLKNPFARRKSSGNVLEAAADNTDAAPQSSFRVIERPEKSKIVLDGPDRRSAVPRPFASPLHALRGKSVDDLTYSAGGTVDTAASRKSAASLQKLARGSGGTTGSGLSEFYESSAASARHSSSSTLPSSVEPENDLESDGELFAQQWSAATRKPLPLTPEASLPLPPSFSARAQRAFSFGLGRKPVQESTSPSATSPTVLIKPTISHSPTRERAETTSSYASTAVPSAIEPPRANLNTSDFGGSFGDMFEHLGDSKKQTAAVSTPVHRTDSPPIYPPKTYARQSYTPSPHGLRDTPTRTDSPYAQTRRTSKDGLLDSASNSPRLGHESQGYFSNPKVEYALVSNDTSPNLSKQSSQEYLSASAGVSANPSQDDIKRYELRDPQDTPVPKTRNQRESTIRFNGLPSLQAMDRMTDELEMVEIDTKADNRKSALLDDEPLFDARTSRTPRPAAVPQSISDSSLPKRLTKAQFDILQKYPSHAAASSTDKDDSGDEYDDEDDKERLKQVANQRRKQEANLSLYRQQMKKVTGGGPTDLPSRPAVDRAYSSSPSLHLSGVPSAPPAESFRPKQQDQDEDDDVPLAILQAHGFPSNTRAPSQALDGSSGLRPTSTAPRNSTTLPPFARHLPEDPYFGAGIVNPGPRESLAFGSGGSTYGGPISQPGTPGGLVGVIFQEERQRQARRGSPNPQTGTYPGMPLPANMPVMNRAPSTPNMPLSMMAPGMPVMPQMPPTDSAHLQQFMATQMQMMQNMQNMIQMQQAQINSQMGPSAQAGMPRPPSVASNLGQMPLANQGRSMSMLGTPSTWNVGATNNRPLTAFDPRMSTYAPTVNGLGQQPGYTPSIAPSERSNVGQPSRYRPVTNGSGDGDRRSNSMMSSATLNAFAAQQPPTPSERRGSQHMQPAKSTIRVIEKPKSAPRSSNIENDDDDEGNWADMVKKRLKGKHNRASKTAEDRVALGELYTNVE